MNVPPRRGVQAVPHGEEQHDPANPRVVAELAKLTLLDDLVSATACRRFEDRLGQTRAPFYP